MVTVDEVGRASMVATGSGVALDYRPALDLGGAPPAAAVLLGTVVVDGSAEPVDYWAVPGEVERNVRPATAAWIASGRSVMSCDLKT